MHFVKKWIHKNIVIMPKSEFFMTENYLSLWGFYIWNKIIHFVPFLYLAESLLVQSCWVPLKRTKWRFQIVGVRHLQEKKQLTEISMTGNDAQFFFHAVDELCEKTEFTKILWESPNLNFSWLRITHISSWIFLSETK